MDSRVREAARKAYGRLHKTGPSSLRFKKLAGYEQVWSLRINGQ